VLKKGDIVTISDIAMVSLYPDQDESDQKFGMLLDDFEYLFDEKENLKETVWKVLIDGKIEDVLERDIIKTTFKKDKQNEKFNNI